jgi:endonuclease III
VSTPRRSSSATPARQQTLAAKAMAVFEALHHDRPAARVELDHRTPFELLIATILSAQCTDARVNQVTPALFEAYPDPASMARARTADLESLIRSTGFFRSKARSIQGCCREIMVRHSGEVPRTMEELSRLPGVGRKTANVVLGAAFGIPSGIVVDTHVARVSRRLGLTRYDDPVRIESDLMACLPRETWIFFSIAMVLHGRYVCLARTPRCGECALRTPCPSAEKVPPAARRQRRGRAPGRS